VGFSFLGFLTSLLDFCWPFGIRSPLLAERDGAVAP
jgi:hypothetical protein